MRTLFSGSGLRRGAVGLAALVLGAVAVVAFAAPASAAQPPPCTSWTEVTRSGHALMVPTVKGSVSCRIGRDFTVSTTVVSRFQYTLRTCYPGLRLASPYSDEKVGTLATDGTFGPRTEAALKAVQSHIGTAADGIYGPDTRDRMRFVNTTRTGCYGY